MESFVSLTHRLRYGNLSSAPTLKPVVTPAWSLSDRGVLLQAPAGTLVRASAAGRVDRVHLDRPAGWFELSLDHGHGLWTTYAGMGAMTVEAGDFVQKGQPLGLTARSDSGTTGPALPDPRERPRAHLLVPPDLVVEGTPGYTRRRGPPNPGGPLSVASVE